MKKYMISLAAAAAFVTTPAMANEFAGARVEATAGVDDVTGGVDATKVAYGAALGYDVQLGKIVIGVDATAGNVFDRADLGVGARLGYALNDNVLAYGRVGYTNLERPRGANLDGLTIGGGIEAKLTGPFYTKLEYRYTDFNGGVGRHASLIGLGVRF